MIEWLPWLPSKSCYTNLKFFETLKDTPNPSKGFRFVAFLVLEILGGPFRPPTWCLVWVPKPLVPGGLSETLFWTGASGRIPITSNFTANFYQRCKQETTRSAVIYFIVSAFPLSGKSNYVVEEFSAEYQRASPPEVRQVVGIPCQFFIERTPVPYLV